MEKTDKTETVASENAAIKKREKFIVNCAYAALIFGIAYLAFRYAIFAIMPFFIAFIVATLIRPLINFTVKKLRLKRGIASIIWVVLFYGVVGVGLLFAVIRLYVTARDLVLRLPQMYVDTIEPALISMFDELEKMLADLSPSVGSVVDTFADNLISSVSSAISTFSVNLVGSITKFATSLPSALLSTLITLISTFFMAADYKLITTFVMKQFKPHTAEVILKIKDSLGSILGEYLKSYAIIMGITFVEIFGGLWIIGVKNAALIALIVAVFDILPVVGSGLVMFPWAVITLIQGNIGRGLGLLALWLFVIIVRNIMEPRIIGQRVGLHPVITLIAMVLGVSIFGGIGLFALPISLAIIKRMNDQGTIHIYSSLSAQEKKQIEPEPRKKKKTKSETAESEDIK